MNALDVRRHALLLAAYAERTFLAAFGWRAFMFTLAVQARLSAREVARRTGIAQSGLYELYHDRTTVYAHASLNRHC